MRGTPEQWRFIHTRGPGDPGSVVRDNRGVTEFQSELAANHDNIGKLPKEHRQHAGGIEVLRKGAGDPAATRARKSQPYGVPQRLGQKPQQHRGSQLKTWAKRTRRPRSFAKALAIQEGLERENPSVTEFQSELAASHVNIGNLQRNTRQMEPALKSYGKALAIRERLVRDNPRVTEFQSDLAPEPTTTSASSRATKAIPMTRFSRTTRRSRSGSG